MAVQHVATAKTARAASISARRSLQGNVARILRSVFSRGPKSIMGDVPVSSNNADASDAPQSMDAEAYTKSLVTPGPSLPQGFGGWMDQAEVELHACETKKAALELQIQRKTEALTSLLVAKRDSSIERAKVIYNELHMLQDEHTNIAMASAEWRAKKLKGCGMIWDKYQWLLQTTCVVGVFRVEAYLRNGGEEMRLGQAAHNMVPATVNLELVLASLWLRYRTEVPPQCSVVLSITFGDAHYSIATWNEWLAVLALLQRLHVATFPTLLVRFTHTAPIPRRQTQRRNPVALASQDAVKSVQKAKRPRDAVDEVY